MTERYQRHPELRVTAVEGEGVVLHLGTRKYYSVSESGHDLLEALVRPRTLDELVAVLTDKYDVTAEQALAATREFLEHGRKAGMITSEQSP